MVFREKGYVYIKNLFSKEECEECINRMFNATQNNNHNDTDCLLSDNYYNLFRDVLLYKQNIIEKYVGLSLLPSYSYSRIYKKGETLGVHRDRESCEVTITATLGFDGSKVWPIYMSLKDDVKSFEINSGDALAMDGMNYDHWRNEYVEGNWQAQVFLHYVDANGPFTMHVNDSVDQKENFGIEVNY